MPLWWVTVVKTVLLDWAIMGAWCLADAYHRGWLDPGLGLGPTGTE